MPSNTHALSLLNGFVQRAADLDKVLKVDYIDGDTLSVRRVGGGSEPQDEIRISSRAFLAYGATFPKEMTPGDLWRDVTPPDVDGIVLQRLR